MKKEPIKMPENEFDGLRYSSSSKYRDEIDKRDLLFENEANTDNKKIELAKRILKSVLKEEIKLKEIIKKYENNNKQTKSEPSLNQAKIGESAENKTEPTNKNIPNKIAENANFKNTLPAKIQRTSRANLPKGKYPPAGGIGAKINPLLEADNKEKLLEHILVANNNNHKTNQKLQEHFLIQAEKHKQEDHLADGVKIQLHGKTNDKLEEGNKLQGKTHEKLDEISKKLDKPEVQKVEFANGEDKDEEDNAAGRAFFKLLKGKPGKDGYNPEKGKDYFTEEEKAEFLAKATPQKGVHYNDGEPGKDADEEKIIKEVAKKFKQPKDGKTPEKGVDYFDGKDGYTPVKGKDYFDGKDAEEIKPEKIIELMRKAPKGKKLKYKDIEDAPEWKPGKMGGTGYFREITDVAITNPQTGDIPTFNKATNKWENKQIVIPTGAVTYKGVLDASGGSYPASPAKGDYYIISVAGTISGKVYGIGDWAVYDGTVWDKIDNQTVTDVFHTDKPAEISALTDKATPVDADVFLIEDSETTPTAFGKKKLTLAHLKAAIGGAPVVINIYTDTFDVGATDTTCVCDKATDLTANLPAATGSGRIIIIKNIGAGAATVTPNGSETIDAEATQVLYPFEAISVQDYASGAWLVI